MEIQFTIKVVGSNGNAATPKKDRDTQSTTNDDETTSQASLGKHPGLRPSSDAKLGAAGNAPEEEADPLGSGGGDPLGSGGGAPGMGQIFVIGPIVISAGGTATVAGQNGSKKRSTEDEQKKKAASAD
jgi:hypothetical protein